MIDDIHLNPVRKGLVEQARDWKWSSAGWFENQPLNELKPDPIPWDWLEDDSESPLFILDRGFAKPPVPATPPVMTMG